MKVIAKLGPGFLRMLFGEDQGHGTRWNAILTRDSKSKNLNDWMHTKGIANRHHEEKREHGRVLLRWMKHQDTPCVLSSAGPTKWRQGRCSHTSLLCSHISYCPVYSWANRELAIWLERRERATDEKMDGRRRDIGYAMRAVFSL